MGEIPHEVLSDHFQERMEGCRLVAAVFVTYQFDPGFFEQEILPAFIDAPLSHVPAIRLLQLEDALRCIPAGVAVYYDANGIVRGDSGSACLDIRRIPVRHKTGIFHPKNAFILVEAAEPGENAYRPRTLLVASMSANLTRRGWWENVECCHVEELHEGDRTRLKDDVAEFLGTTVRRRAPKGMDHQALEEILAFLKKVDQRHHKSVAGHAHTHFYVGQEPLADFFERLVGREIRGWSLEVISPYFDDSAECGPLMELVERFEPREVRVCLPRDKDGNATVRRDLYETVAKMPNVRWSRLGDKGDTWLRSGRVAGAPPRAVHAKVYRFFRMKPRREITFVGSANLTSAAHSGRGNVETGFLVDTVPDVAPDFWTVVERAKPAAFEPRGEDDGVAASGGTRLNLRYHWDTATAEASWEGSSPSPTLKLRARDVDVGEIGPLSPREWAPVPDDVAATIGKMLPETSLFEVHGENEEPGLLLVQEEGMSHKPSGSRRLAASEILRYWSLLTPDQRAEVIEVHGERLTRGEPPGPDGPEPADDGLTLFDRFAGYFHGFGCLERAVLTAIKEDRRKEADYRLFGCKYDSLGSLLDRLDAKGEVIDPVDRYLIVLCARQVCRQIAKEEPRYWQEHAADVATLTSRLAKLGTVREELSAGPDGTFAAFLDWFEPLFLTRAKPKESADA